MAWEHGAWCRVGHSADVGGVSRSSATLQRQVFVAFGVHVGGWHRHPSVHSHNVVCVCAVSFRTKRVEKEH